ncbi:hypothetical protein [Paraburkholderia kirstenboschensis]
MERLLKHLPLQRRVGFVKIDTGDEAIDRRVNGGRIAAKNIAGVAEHVRHDAQIRDTARIDLLQFISAGALIVVPQAVVFTSGFKAASRSFA